MVITPEDSEVFISSESLTDHKELLARVQSAAKAVLSDEADPF